MWNHPWRDILLEQDKEAKRQGQHNAVLEGAGEHLALPPFQIGHRGAGRDVLRGDHLSHHAARGVGRREEHGIEAELIGRPWEQVRPGLDVKLLAHEGELYVQAQSQDRVSKERAMRRRRLRKLWNRLCELQKMKLNTKALLIKIGEAKKEAGRAFGLIDLKLPNPSKSKKKKPKTKPRFSFRINRAKFRNTYRREGRYLLRSNLSAQPELQLLLKELKLRLPDQPPPKIAASGRLVQ